MTEPAVLVQRDEAVVTVILNRPQARNALDLTMRQALDDALAQLADDPAVRVLVLRGAGEHFCAGGDVKLMQAARMSAAEGQARVAALNRAVRRLVRFRAPTIAMVDGFAVGAGSNLAIACDLVIASTRARFGEVFARLGLIPDGGGVYLLPRRIGLARAKELAFTAEVLDAEAAARIGLVNRVVTPETLEAETRVLARQIAEGPPRALSLAKALLDRSLELDLDTALEWEALAQGLLIDSADHREGLAAFFERRRPRFTGA
ncbi:MAG TPA: enoyl-CoA hydratase [Methylomirabilota bacterium]|nr:enoyl-CoA hydratase [Methylomirabilota bacterium]